MSAGFDQNNRTNNDTAKDNEPNQDADNQESGFLDILSSATIGYFIGGTDAAIGAGIGEALGGPEGGVLGGILGELLGDD